MSANFAYTNVVEANGYGAFSFPRTSQSTSLLGKVPSVCGLTSRRSPRQRTAAHGGHFAMSITKICENCGAIFTIPPCRLKRRPIRFCSMACFSAFAKRPEVIALRFWKYVDTSAGPNACWPWLAHCDRDGYGRFSYKSGKRGAHVVAYELTNGPLPDLVAGEPVELMHLCDNPPCCNPAHLRPGNAALNKSDSVRKGRHAAGKRNGRYKHGRRAALVAA